MKYIYAEKLKEQIQFLIDSGYDKLQGSLYHVLSIIDSLQQEQPMVDLEKAADNYAKVFSDVITHPVRRDAFEAGANWQKGKDSKISEEIDQNFTKSSDENFDAEVQKALDEMSEHMKTVEPEISFWDLLAKQYRHFVDWKEKQMLNSAVTGAVIGVGPLADSGPYDSKKSTRRSSATISVVNVPYCEISDIIKLIIIKP